MDLRLRKLHLAAAIMSLGMLTGLAWAGWQGWGLGRGYPDNTILSMPKLKYGDFTIYYRMAGLPSPFDDRYAIYPPAVYPVFRLLRLASLAVALSGFLVASYFAAVSLQDWALRRLFRARVYCGLTTVLLALISYPVLLCFDRGNIEILLVLLIGTALLLLEKRRFTMAAILIGLAMTLKFYPGVLLLLFLRRRQVMKAAGAALSCALVTWLSLLTFAHSIPENMTLWFRNYAFFDTRYVFLNDGLAGSASPWNGLKICFLSVGHFLLGMKLETLVAKLPLVLTGYKLVYLGLLVGLALFVTLIERELFRRALLLLFVVTTSATNGGDYKLLFIHLALIVLILIPTQRRHDFSVTALLALTLVPKKEVFFTFLGASDTGVSDISVGVILNPLLLLTAATLLVYDAWRLRKSGYARQRYLALACQFVNWTPGRGRRVWITKTKVYFGPVEEGADPGETPTTSQPLSNFPRLPSETCYKQL